MRENISRVLKIAGDCVSVKATTEEGLGFTGNMQGLAAKAVVLLQGKGS
jgi:2-C-methyl-D-erythritol 2,4-cyclodiphosphate synthase